MIVLRPHILLLLISTLLLGACSSAVRWDPQPATRTASKPSRVVLHRNASLGAEVVRTANLQVGVPYRYGGASPRGFDCSGLVHYAYREAGQRVPRTTTALYRTAQPVSLDELRPGDILFFYFDDKVGHVASYTGGGGFVHAPSSGKRVMQGTLRDRFWRERLVSAGRLF